MQIILKNLARAMSQIMFWLFLSFLSSVNSEHLQYFLTSTNTSFSQTFIYPTNAPEFTHFRINTLQKSLHAGEKNAFWGILPGIFPDNAEYHFDGLATVMKITAGKGEMKVELRAYDSAMYENYKECNSN